MSVAVSNEPIVVSTARTVALAPLFAITASSSNPTYLVLNAFDRNQYTVGASGATGTLHGAGLNFGLTTSDGDARETGIVFAYQAATGRYYSASAGYLDQLTYTASSSLGDITDLSLFATSSLRTANAYASNAYALMQLDAAGYRGTATIATLPGFAGPVPIQATPQSVAAIANSFVGDAWNLNGCWTLTSTIAAEAGASMPVQSTVDAAGQARGEWLVAFNGPAGASGDWQSMVRAGDMVGFITASGGGHVTTCVAGSGSSAELVDNEELVDWSGNVLNPANDGSADDIIIQAAHDAALEWSGVQASSVVIYRLDTPIVTAAASVVNLAAGAVQGLASLFSASDPAAKTVTQYQLYNSDANDTLLVNGSSIDAESAATAASVGSLSAVSLDAGQTGGTDLVSVRAFNGTYWGDWTSLSVVSAAGTTVPLTGTTVPLAHDTPSPTVTTAMIPITSDTVSIYRFFDKTDGTHFFTASATERDSLIATRPDLDFEGVGMDAVAPGGSDAAAEAVYRFFDAAHGTHFFTASSTERDSLIASRPDMTFEGTAFYEDASPVSGDSAVYRFFDTTHGTHLYTESAAEKATILASRPDLTPEGIAFYAPA